MRRVLFSDALKFVDEREGPFTAFDVAKALDVDRNRAVNVVAQMVAKKKIAAIGWQTEGHATCRVYISAKGLVEGYRSEIPDVERAWRKLMGDQRYTDWVTNAPLNRVLPPPSLGHGNQW
jgi:hypothetical protein